MCRNRQLDIRSAGLYEPTIPTHLRQSPNRKICGRRREQMDVLEKRREIRRKKILQNTEDRLKKVTSAHGAGTQHDYDLPKSSVSYFNESSSKNINLAPSEDLTTSQRLKPSGQEKGDDLSTEYASADCNETNSVEQVDGCDIKEKIKRFHEVYEEQQTETGDTETTTKGTKSKSRIVMVIVYAVLCFYSSVYWPLIAQVTGFPGEVEQHSFIIPFCLLELFFLCIPLSRKVVPGQKVNLWVLALKLCGVSPILLEKLQFAILKILEFLTDLAMFIFVLAILQNISDVRV